jgi:hypothetical protein
MKDKFKNKDGSLTVYALACGYVQKVEKAELSAELYHEGAVYQVRYFNRNADFSLPFNDPNGGRFWLSFDNLTEARKVYNKLASSVLSGNVYHSTSLLMAGLKWA